MDVFLRDQLVVVKDESLGILDELAYVDHRIFGTSGYEVVLIKDHNPGQAFDPIRIFDACVMHPASSDEIEIKKLEWEAANNHRLPFRIQNVDGKHLISA